MHELLKPYILMPLFTTVIVGVSIAYYWVNKRSTAKFYSFLSFLALIFIWSSGQTLERLVDSTEVKWALVKFQYVGIVYLTLCGLIFTLYYTDNPIVNKKKIIFPLFIPATVFLIALFTNDLHHLFYKVYNKTEYIFGPVFYVHSFFAYFWYLCAFFILIKYSLRNSGNIRKQAVLIIVSLTIPVVVNAVCLLYTQNPAYSYFNIDYTPSSFILFVLLLSIATIKYRFLNITPIALGLVFKNMYEGIVILDTSDRVVKYNQSFMDMFKRYSRLNIDENISVFIDNIRRYSCDDVETNNIFSFLQDSQVFNVKGEFLLKDFSINCFSVNIKPIKLKNKEAIGRIISFDNISQFKALLNSVKEKNAQLSEKNSELSNMYQRLKEHNDTLEELTIQRERNRVAMDIHDTLGHTMTLLLKQLEVINIYNRKDPELTESKIKETIKIVTEGLGDLKRSIVGMKPERIRTESLMSSLEELLSIFDSSHIEFELLCEGKEKNTNISIKETVFRVCQEAITNSIRHGKATKAAIVVRFLEESLKVHIIDNGKGCEKIFPGFGLTSMEKRVSSLNGSIYFSSDGESGFNIYLDIPYGGNCIDKGSDSR